MKKTLPKPKFWISYIWILLFSSYLQAQIEYYLPGDELFKYQCGTVQEFKIDDFKLEKENLTKNLLNDTVCIIPVVFHIIHDDGYENVRREKIIEALDGLNERFNLQNSDTIDIPEPFRAIMGNARIELSV